MRRHENTVADVAENLQTRPEPSGWRVNAENTKHEENEHHMSITRMRLGVQSRATSVRPNVDRPKADHMHA